MRIICWNVNGLRAHARKGAFQWIIDQSPDIFCLQETKALPDQLPEEVRNVSGYHAYFDSPKEKKGYSGVAIYSKIKPISVTYEMGVPVLDTEGRLITAEYDNFVLLNVYFPNGKRGPERLSYKMEFYKEFLRYINKLRKKGKNIVFCGDVNTAHFPIDLARAKENEKISGFLPIERDWLDEVVKAQYIDVFRYFYPEKVAYTWWDTVTKARERDVGWRIDYFFTNKEFLKNVKDMVIHKDILGSDHCPIELILK